MSKPSTEQSNLLQKKKRIRFQIIHIVTDEVIIVKFSLISEIHIVRFESDGNYKHLSTYTRY